MVLTNKIKRQKREIGEKIIKNNIESRPFLAGNFTIQPVVSNFEHVKDNDLNISQSISENGLAIPCHQDINEKDINKVTSIIKEFLDDEI